MTVMAIEQSEPTKKTHASHYAGNGSVKVTTSHTVLAYQKHAFAHCDDSDDGHKDDSTDRPWEMRVSAVEAWPEALLTHQRPTS